MRTSSLPSTLFGFGVLVAAAVGLVAPGCGGDEKACTVGKTECLSDTLARTCAKSGKEREPTWIPFTCSDGSSCQDGAGAGADASADDSEGSGEAACVGTCEVGVAECITPELSRYCDNGLSWELDPCEVGEQCVNGHCQLSADGATVKACEPGAKACAAPNIEKVCDADGTSWIPVACAAHEVCDEAQGECVPSDGASCDALGSGICIDDSTAIRCSAITGGYEQVDCPTGTYCSGGRCRGEICAIGSTCNASNQIVECLDGINQTVTQCAANEVCVQNGDRASCIVPRCIPNTVVCGDANNPGSIDPTTAYSQCVANTQTGLPEWQLTTCQGNLKCDPGSVGTTTPCREECTAGVQTCWNSSGAGVQDGWRECQDDGTWGPIQNCNDDPTALALICANRPHQEAGALNQVACAEPVCADVWNNLGPVSSIEGAPAVQGVCEGAQIRPCDENGRLSDTAVTCTEGICQIQGTVQEDGLRRGTCFEMASCDDGEAICVTANGSQTSFFRSCVDGVFSSVLERCPNDDPCFTGIDQDGTRSKYCGGECAPGWTRCNGTDQVQTCGADGTYADGVACQVGHCEDVGNNQAKCVLACIPGEFGCDGTPKLASDQLHTGTTHAVTCRPDGTWPSIFDSADDAYVEQCAGTTTCRVSDRGEGLGCVECIGPDVLGGNSEGVIDTRCDPSSSTNLQTCTASNTWGTSGCATGTTCIGPQPVCGSCNAESGIFLSECSEALINNLAETCSDCFLPGGGYLPQCSESLLPFQSLDGGVDGGPQSCEDFGLGPASPWGGVSDCCSGTDFNGGAIRFGEVATCTTQGYGTASAWGGVADCCSDRQTFTTAGAMAYCAPTG